MSNRLRCALAASVAILWLTPQPARAARVLFVSDSRTDLSIESVLRLEGHSVTSVESDFFAGMNPSLRPDLSMYDCVVWSASNDGSHARHTDTDAFRSLSEFASSGGSVFVTGNGSVGFRDDLLIQFLGGTSGDSYTGSPLAIAALDTNLTTGVVDIRGVTPANRGELSWEALLGLASDTIAIVGASSRDHAAQWSIRSLGTGHIAWVAGLGGVDDEWTDPVTGPAGAFNAALRNFVTASTGTASEPGAPRVAFDAPFTASEGDPLSITARVTDLEGDTVTFSWDLDGDGAYGQSPNVSTVRIPAGTTDGPRDFVVSVEASDGVHTSHRARAISIANVAPRITSRAPLVAAITQHIRYAVAVVDPGGAHDVPSFTLTTGPSTAVLTPDGVFDWTPTESEVTAPGTSRAVRVDVDDGDGGFATQTWSMVVIDDHAPTDPILLYPAADAPILIRGVHLAIGNASDLDGDPITYTFEIASNAMFDEGLQTSGPRDESATGITEWSPDEGTLSVGRWYWRVTASDGRVSTSPQIATFLLVPDPSLFPDAGSGDAGPDAGMASSTPRGCGCGVSSPRSRFGTSLAIAAVITLWVLCARRRR